MLGCTIDYPSGLLALHDYVERFTPQFPIGALDQATVNSFGHWTRRPYVPQVYLIDKAGVIRGQFMGTDGILEGDQRANLRAAINHLMGVSGGGSTPVVKKK